MINDIINLKQKTSSTTSNKRYDQFETKTKEQRKMSYGYLPMSVPGTPSAVSWLLMGYSEQKASTSVFTVAATYLREQTEVINNKTKENNISKKTNITNTRKQHI
jgi:hypothetical protein